MYRKLLLCIVVLLSAIGATKAEIVRLALHVSGDSAVGLGDSVTLGLPSPVQVANGSFVAFTARTAAPSGGDNPNAFYQSREGVLSLVTADGREISPSSETLIDGLLFTASGNPNGVAILNAVSDSDGRSDAILVGNEIGLTLLAREGGANPAGGGLFNTLAQPLLNAVGESAFRARVNDGGTLRDLVMVRTSAALVELAREGQAAPDCPGGVYASLGDELFLNDNAHVAFRSSLGGAATSLDDDAIFSNRSGTLGMIVREGDLAPANLGALRFGSFDLHGFNNAGQILFASSLRSESNGAVENPRALFLTNGLEVKTVARVGSTPPGAGFAIASFTDSVVSGGGLAGFAAILEGSQPFAEREGIWVGEPDGPLEKIAVAGDTCPGLPAGWKFRRLATSYLQMNADGDLAFYARVGPDSGGLMDSLWVWRRAVGGEAVAWQGQQVPVRGAPRTLSTLHKLAVSSGGQDGRQRYLADDGNLAFTMASQDVPALSAVILAERSTGGENQAPVAIDDMFEVRTKMGKGIRLRVLENDSDSDGDSVRLLSVSKPLHGKASISVGEILYTPGRSFTGEDSFTYTIGDGNGGEGVGTVTVRNPLLGLRGKFSMVVEGADAPLAIDVSVSGGGMVRGKVFFETKTYRFHGMLDLDGSIAVSLPSASPPVALSLRFSNPDGVPLVQGSVSVGSAAPLILPATAAQVSGPLIELVVPGRYHWTISGGVGTDEPKGTGWVSMVVAKNGSVRLLGVGPGSMPLSAGFAVRQDGSAGFLANLRGKNPGSLRGELVFSTVPARVTGQVMLDRRGSLNSGVPFANGFSFTRSIDGGLYTAPDKGSFALNFSNSANPIAIVRLVEGSPIGPMEQSVVFRLGDKAQSLSDAPAAVKLKLNRTTGVTKGKFQILGESKLPFSGIVLGGSENRVLGVFSHSASPEPAQTGTVEIAPQ